MIDKSVAYYDVIMSCPQPLQAILPPPLPPEYAYQMYQPGDAAHWSRIATAVDEFDCCQNAYAYFAKEFLPHEEELPKRMAFITNPQGMPVAHATAWGANDENLGRIPLLHWVAVIPQEQGKGLGRAISMKVLSLFGAAGPSGDIWLTTQTWSHVAIGLCLTLGFRPHRHRQVKRHANGYEGAARVLKKVMPEKTYARFIDTTTD